MKFEIEDYVVLIARDTKDCDDVSNVFPIMVLLNESSIADAINEVRKVYPSYEIINYHNCFELDHFELKKTITLNKIN